MIRKINFKFLTAVVFLTLLSLYVFNYKIVYHVNKLSNWKHPPSVPKTDVDGVAATAKAITKIAFWIPPKFYVPKSEVKTRIALQNYTIHLINQEQNKICRDPDLSEFRSLNPCQLSFARDDVTDADAVVLWMFNRGFNVSELPPMEFSQEIPRIAFIREPPPLSYWKNPLKGLVTMTMSYRKDSDIWSPYAKTMKLHTPLSEIIIANHSIEDWISGKTKLISSVISNCHTASKREKLVEEMNSTGIIAIDVYGRCGKPFKCGRYAKNCDSSWAKFGEEYKFFLAFENSICEDYITEKLWRTLRVGMVPVVYGGGNYERDLPPKSFINVKDFNSSLALMTYLKFVADNRTEYAKYFEWRKTHEVVDNSMLEWCSLCKVVQNIVKFPKKKVYFDLQAWWQHKISNASIPVCSKPGKNIFA